MRAMHAPCSHARAMHPVWLLVDLGTVTLKGARRAGVGCWRISSGASLIGGWAVRGIFIAVGWALLAPWLGLRHVVCFGFLALPRWFLVAKRVGDALARLFSVKWMARRI